MRSGPCCALSGPRGPCTVAVTISPLWTTPVARSPTSPNRCSLMACPLLSRDAFLEVPAVAGDHEAIVFPVRGVHLAHHPRRRRAPVIHAVTEPPIVGASHQDAI